jgi:broad specificity phosphatase PhoE
MTRFCLVRHGQTAWNLEGRYQGQSDIPLNAAGLEQARELARTLQNVRFDAVYSSDLVRALETANTIIALHDHLQVHVDPRLREINQGEWEGVQIEEIRTQYAHLWQARQVDPVNLRPPGGETVGEVFQRMHSALDEIARLFQGGNVLVVSHGLALATILCFTQGFPIGQAYQHIPDNSVPNWISWQSPAQPG